MPITFQPHLHVEIAAPDTVYVLGEGERFALSGRAYVRLAALLLEAAHDEATMLARLAAELNPAALRLALASLRGRGLVAEVAHDHGSRAAAFRAAAGVDARATEASLHEQRICVRALPPLDAEATVQTLRDVFPRAEAGEPADGALHVVVVEDYLAPALAAWNDEALARRWTWTLLRPVGTSIWLGPLFAPGEACWACLAFKLRGHRAVEAAVARQLGRDRPPVLTRASLPSTERLAAALLTTELAKHVLGSEQARLDGHVLSFDVLTASLERHRLARREACAACGDARVRTEAPPIVLAPAPKTRDGSQRTRSPQAMLRDRLHLVSPITGVVSRLDRVSAEDDELLHVYRATHPQATMSRTLDGIRELLQSSSAGKGQTDAQARASALGEAIERYSGIFQGHEPRRRATFRELDGAIHPDAVLLFSAAQLDGRDEWNRSHARQHWAPARLDPDEAIEWSPLFR